MSPINFFFLNLSKQKNASFFYINKINSQTSTVKRSILISAKDTRSSHRNDTKTVRDVFSILMFLTSPRELEDGFTVQFGGKLTGNP